MSDADFSIDEAPCSLPPGVAEADPAQRIADDMRRAAKLRDLLRNRRTEGRDALRTLLLKLLEVADALERILAVTPTPGNAAEQRQWDSIRVTRKLLDEALRQQNVTPIDLLGQEADPAWCEVDSTEVRPDLPDETVIRELIRGYAWGDEPAPLRPAVVIISRRA